MVRQNFPTNEQVFGKPKNVFSRENSNKLTSPPTPMSTTSRMPSTVGRNSDVHMRSIQTQRQFPRNRNSFAQNRHPFTDLSYLADMPDQYQQDFEYLPEEQQYQNYIEPPEYQDIEYFQNHEIPQDSQEENFLNSPLNENPS